VLNKNTCFLEGQGHQLSFSTTSLIVFNFRIIDINK